MKAIKNILSICSVALLLGSCQADLLETKPYGNVAAGNMWTSETLQTKELQLFTLLYAKVM